jgi:hypothetical protein
MTGLRRLLLACAIALCVMAAGAGVASAKTFFVNGRSGSDAGTCQVKLSPCQTIKGAIKRSEEAPGGNTIEVTGEEFLNYEEHIELTHAQDNNLTIVGEDTEGLTEVLTKGGGPTVTIGAAAGTVTLSNLRVAENVGGSSSVIVEKGAAVTLNGLKVENESESSPGDAIEAHEGSVTINGGEVVMARGTAGSAILAEAAPLSVNGAKVICEEESHAGGILSKGGQLSVVNSSARVVEPETGSKLGDPTIEAEEDSSATLTNDSVVGESRLSAGVELNKTPSTVTGLNVEMRSELSIAAGVEVRGGNATLGHVTVSGKWDGIPLLGVETSTTLSDSHLASAPASTSQAVRFFGIGEGNSLIVQRSVIEAPAGALASLLVSDGNATVDSSEILGGKSGVDFIDGAPVPRQVTVAASTIDAGAPGLVADAAGVHGVEVAPAGSLASANTVIEGSIVLEPDEIKPTAGGQATIACTFSAVASVAASGCEAGKQGNTNASAEATALFSEPFTTYNLSATSSAINSVPSGAITLPFGVTPSTTDLAGNPRTGDGTDACFTGQDKGALELQGHLVSCAAATGPSSGGSTQSTPKAVAAVLSALAISPTAFHAAPKGASISKATKKKYGAKVSYRDSEAATTTFTVYREETGRKQGHSCKKPSRSNKHGKRCTTLKRIGTFTHIDLAGADSLHFSGRINGKKLAKGSYRLQAVAGNAAGTSATVSAKFEVK